MTILGSIAAVTPLAAQPDEGVITDIEQGINDAFTPIADAVTSVVFWQVPLGDYSFPLIVLWLVAAAAIFTVYFNGVQFRSLGTSLALVRGRYSRSSDPGRSRTSKRSPRRCPEPWGSATSPASRWPSRSAVRAPRSG